MALFDDQTELIRALFLGASAASDEENGGWSGFLARLVNVTQADHAAICIDGIDSWTSGAGPVVPPDVRQRLRVDRVYDQDGLPLAIWRDGFLRVVKARIGPSATITVWVQRKAHRKDFRSSDGQTLSALTPFLGQAAEIWTNLARERSEADLSNRVAAGLGGGWLLFDRTGAVRSMSHTVVDWSERHSLRLAERRRFESPDAEVAQSFRQAFARTVSDGTREAVVVTRAPRSELVLVPATGTDEGAILGLLREAPSANAVDDIVIARHFNLSRSEARLVAQLCDGQTIRTAAEVLGWTEETARTTSKSVFVRLGVNGQPALVRRVLGGGLWF